ncbi:CAF1-domain-containing protein [Coniochaeta ligniaria NRRL 30616]|uniref:CAF1-domain-containing protein n=1 Tax=Coniochaeta ligniaria NRRL 30616 TaxID=1408157 RepID=A0A1J7JVG2_9PEZI|nr:CAF1-domain-containing protein [Coniochaeta ligniaria NRRL 30616]
MEITAENFWKSLPEVLEAMAAATYVSIDLEMTGIGTNRIMSSAKITIDVVYEQAKLAAERFQIVQFGLTCISHSQLTKAYHARTFNFLITPSFTGTRTIDHRLARVLDRYVGLSHNSVIFLREHDFDMDRAFKDGVSFLSMHEMAELGPKFLHYNPDAIDPADRVVLADHDQEAIDFHGYVHRIIDEWYTSMPRVRNFVNITNPYGGKLNALQVRMIRELVNDQYAECRAFPRGDRDFMQVVIRDPAREAQDRARVLAEKMDAVARQKGFSFVIEALMGAPFAEAFPVDYIIDDKAADRDVEIRRARDHLKRLQSKLIREQPILIGHNSLYDLCFMYRSFYAPLPDSIDEFGMAIHYLFPRMVDTKFLARRGNHSMLADDTLSELFQSANNLDMPKIIKDADMSENVLGEYLGIGMDAHQAGFDSWMTAVVFLKYAWALAEKAEAYKSPTSSEMARDEEDRKQQAANLEQLREALKNVDLTATTAAWEKHRAFEESRRTALQQPGANPELAPLIAGFPAPPVPSYGTMQPDTSWLFHEPATTPVIDPNTSWLLDPTPEPSPGPHPTVGLNKEPLREELTTDCQMSFADGRIPDWDTDFWRVYGNKLRMGLAGVLDLDEVGPAFSQEE